MKQLPLNPTTSSAQYLHHNTMTSETSKQSVLITGCSKGGIGDALAQEFHTRGFTVFATARNLDKIQHLKELGCDIFALDVTDEKSIQEAVEYVSQKTGGQLHYLINNAGLSKLVPQLYLPHFTSPLSLSHEPQNTC
jgi:NADP-dependent 3-hydroxy acid dehydrogenase YdfG